MKRILGWLLIFALALMILPTASAAAMDSGAGSSDSGYVYFDNYVNSTLGYSTTATGTFTNPGPTYTAMDNQTMEITLYASDQFEHVFYIDVNGNRMLDVGDLIAADSYNRSANWYVTFMLPAGTYT